MGIEYCALNHFDVNAIHKEINSVTLPFIPGSQFSGEILDIGPKCSREFKIGEKVVVFGMDSIACIGYVNPNTISSSTRYIV